MTFTYDLDRRELNGRKLADDANHMPPTLAAVTRRIEREHGPITRWTRPTTERVVTAELSR